MELRINPRFEDLFHSLAGDLQLHSGHSFGVTHYPCSC